MVEEMGASVDARVQGALLVGLAWSGVSKSGLAWSGVSKYGLANSALLSKFWPGLIWINSLNLN